MIPGRRDFPDTGRAGWVSVFAGDRSKRSFPLWRPAPNKGRLTRTDAPRSVAADLDEIFIQPAPGSDASVRERVRARYGRPMADE